MATYYPHRSDDDGWKRQPRQLTDIADECREIVLRAVKDLGPDLGGYSALDLVADNIEHVSLADLRAALVVAGIDAHVSARVARQYSLRED
jgi:hypothetical protein